MLKFASFSLSLCFITYSNYHQALAPFIFHCGNDFVRPIGQHGVSNIRSFTSQPNNNSVNIIFKYLDIKTIISFQFLTHHVSRIDVHHTFATSSAFVTSPAIITRLSSLNGLPASAPPLPFGITRLEGLLIFRNPGVLVSLIRCDGLPEQLLTLKTYRVRPITLSPFLRA